MLVRRRCEPEVGEGGLFGHSGEVCIFRGAGRRMGEPAKSIVTIGYAAANESKIRRNPIGYYRDCWGVPFFLERGHKFSERL